jgi:hypothetical protein
MARRSCDRGNSSHEGTANAENVNMHLDWVGGAARLAVAALG